MSSNCVSHESLDQNTLHHKAEMSSKWSNIKDLDLFFRRLYVYHQKRGFFTIVLGRILELVNYMFVVFLAIYLFHGIEYSVLFADVPGNNPVAGPHSQATFSSSHGKVTLYDTILPLNECISNFTGLTKLILGILSGAWLLLFFIRIYQVALMWETRQFYHDVLKVNDDNLDNLTWREILKKIRDAQLKLNICVIKKELTDMDICHRILRHENFLKGLMQQELLPPTICIPFLPKIVFWTSGFEMNIRLILFLTRWSVFKSSWEIHEEYKKCKESNRAAKKLGKLIETLAFINLVCFPLIFFCQIFYGVLNYGELLKRQPGAFSIRRWSKYSKLYLRHFNEFEEELHIRLCRAYGPTTEYLSTFSRPIFAELAKHIGFVSGSLFVVLVGLMIYDKDVISVDHVLSITSFLGIVAASCRNFTPDKTKIDDPDRLLKQVVEYTHHQPYSWSHTQCPSRNKDMQQILQLFQLRAVGILEWLLSPILTPILMLFWLYPRSHQIVTFFNTFSVFHREIGDVCSFAMGGEDDGIPYMKKPFEMSQEFVPEDTVDVKISIPLEPCLSPSRPYVFLEDSAERVFKNFENVSKFESSINTMKAEVEYEIPATFTSANLIKNSAMLEKEPLLPRSKR
nr:autophagy-related protein 9A-like [Leptinotarsa decemlineata]